MSKSSGVVSGWAFVVLMVVVPGMEVGGRYGAVGGCAVSRNAGCIASGGGAMIADLEHEFLVRLGFITVDGEETDAIVRGELFWSL